MIQTNKEIFHIRAGAFEGFRSLCCELGHNPAEIFDAIGLDESILNFPETLVPTLKFRQALNLAAHLLNNPHFGLHMSQKQTLHKFGAIGYLMVHANTVGQSIVCLDQYLSIHDPGTTAKIEISDGTVLWTVSFSAFGEESIIQHAELGIGIAVKTLRTISRETWRPDAIYFEHEKPSNISIYERIFKCPVYFSQSINAIEFPETFLHTKVPRADPALFNIIKSHIDGVSNQKSEDFTSEVRYAIQIGLERGKPRVEHIAEEFAMSVPQLRRKLKRENTNYQTLLQDTRSSMACKYLSDSDMSLATISALLSYAEPAIFSRAFKKSFGQSPRSWRQQNKS